jgi:glycosyltransferase involved in cell wall biosynthesis
MRFSNARIAISRVIVELIRRKHGRDAVLIPNGVVPVELESADDQIRHFGLESKKYFLQVSRIVPEKRQLDLIKAFAAVRPEGWKLALVGGLENDAYSSRVRAAAERAGIILAGFLNGEPLLQVYSHAGAFVLPSSHEGLPIAMLEALSYGLPVIASDIPANLEVGLEPSRYFPVGDVAALGARLAEIARNPENEDVRHRRRQWVAAKYDWDRIAEQTLAVYQAMQS